MKRLLYILRLVGWLFLHQKEVSALYAEAVSWWRTVLIAFSDMRLTEQERKALTWRGATLLDHLDSLVKEMPKP